MERQNMSGFGIKDCLTQSSLAWKCLGPYNKNREFYTFNDKYVRDYIRRSIKGGRRAALNRYFKPSQCEEILNTMKKHLGIKVNEISNILGEY